MRKGRAVAVVIKDEELLVMFRRNERKEYYTLPGGGIELDESAEQAVVREIKEEASLKIEVERQIYEHHYDDDSKQYFYLCRYISGEPKLSAMAPEQKDVKANIHNPMWLLLNQLRETLLYPLEIRDWIIKDLGIGFPQKIRMAEIQLSQLRRTV